MDFEKKIVIDKKMVNGQTNRVLTIFLRSFLFNFVFDAVYFRHYSVGPSIHPGIFKARSYFLNS